jgi:hypothetical protein
VIPYVSYEMSRSLCEIVEDETECKRQLKAASLSPIDNSRSLKSANTSRVNGTVRERDHRHSAVFGSPPQFGPAESKE